MNAVARAGRQNYRATRSVPDAILVRIPHIAPMTQYIIVPNGDGSGFNITVSGANGARQTMMGFDSEAEAEAWIAQDRRLDGPDEPAPEFQDAGASD
nr:hypothetical protein [uncultured Rhodopila sp.]